MKIEKDQVFTIPEEFQSFLPHGVCKKKMSKTIFFSHLYVIIQSSFVVPTYLYLGNLLIEKKIESMYTLPVDVFTHVSAFLDKWV